MSSHFVYTPSELRANLRAALGFAEAGATVVIDRYGEKFILKHVPKESPYIPDFKQEYTAPPDTPDPELVKAMETYEKNNSVGKPTKPKNLCPEHLIDKDSCKLMKHKGKNG